MSMKRLVPSTWTLLLLALFTAFALPASLGATDTIAKLEARLEREKKPAERARIVAKLAALQLEEVSAAYHEGRYEPGAALLGKLLDGIEEADRGLLTLPVDPRRKSKGFKELEIQVRETIRQLRDVAGTVSFSNRQPIEAGIARLEKVQDSLLNALFESPKPKKSDKVK